MEEEEEEGEVCSTPFWEQSSNNRRRDRIRRLSSLFLNSGLLIFLLCLTALVFAFFVIPSIIQSLRPTVLVKKSWDSVNLVLVLSALVFGFLSRNRNREYDETNPNVTSPRVTNEIQKSNPSTPRQRWSEYDARTVYNSSTAVNGGGALRRNSCSYPDLRDASPWINADDRWRFSDDLLVEAHRHSDSDRFHRRRSWKRVFEEEQELAAPVTRVEEDSYTPPPPSPPAPPPPPGTTIHRKPTRAYESVARREQVKGSEPAKTVAPQAAAALVPPPAPVDSEEEKKSSKSDRKRSGANATKDLFTSIYNQKSNIKKKKQRQKRVENFETLIQPQAPPPSPPSALRNLLSSQKGKGKKIITVPPPSSTAHASRSTTIVPLKTSDFARAAENSNSGGESPLIPIPPPPPPPPFKMPSWRFVVRGDYVRVGSMDSSRSGSPEDSPASTPTAAGGGEAAAGQLFCASPDVDTKADMFIAKFRAGLKLQKMNSMARQKQGLGLSNLGPDEKPGPGPTLI